MDSNTATPRKPIPWFFSALVPLRCELWVHRDCPDGLSFGSLWHIELRWDYAGIGRRHRTWWTTMPSVWLQLDSNHFASLMSLSLWHPRFALQRHISIAPPRPIRCSHSPPCLPPQLSPATKLVHITTPAKHITSFSLRISGPSKICLPHPAQTKPEWQSRK